MRIEIETFNQRGKNYKADVILGLVLVKYYYNNNMNDSNNKTNDNI